MKKLIFVLAVFCVFCGNAFAGTLNPAPQQRDPYDWAERHAKVLEQNRKSPPDYVFIGDSIVHYWAGAPSTPKSGRVNYAPRGEAAWKKIFGNKKVTNAGFGFDYIDNAYYRVEKGELAGIRPRAILILLGTNNLFHLKDSPKDCAEKMKAFLKLVRKKQPRAKILLIGVLPRKEQHSPELVEETNGLYEKLADNKTVFFVNAGTAILGDDGRHAAPECLSDVVHPNTRGYDLIAEIIALKLKQIEK